MDKKGRVRSTVQLRESPAGNAPSVESLDASTPVSILDDQGEWLKVKSVQTGSIPGWVLREALAFSSDGSSVFPDCSLASGRKVPSVPASLAADALQSWLNTLGRPGWFPAEVWDKLTDSAQHEIVDGIQDAIHKKQAEWDAWQARLTAEGRTATAKVDEWTCLQNAGMDVWPVRAERIFLAPAEAHTGVAGWAVEKDILRWTGQVKRNEKEQKYKTWYEVSLYKQNKQLKGWFKGELLDPYIFPTDENDPAVERNADAQFDLQTPLLRTPADPEITDAINAGRGAYQYIDVVRALGSSKIHFNLCGEFCVAALAGRDVIPFLIDWKAVYPRAKDILRNNSGTGMSDVKCMLDTCQLHYEEYRYSPSVSPVSPARIRAELDKGKMAFAGVGIFKRNGKLSGTETDPKKTTRHWVVVEDVKPVGNGGWVRIYNPFFNREEVYPYNLFIQSHGQFPLGLWVTPKGL